MRRAIAMAGVLLSASHALAQPGQTPPQPAPQPQPAPEPQQPPAPPPPQPAPQPQQPPPPQPYPPPPYPYPPPPYPYPPQPYAPQPYPPPPPPPETSRGTPSEWARAVAFFHGLCPDDGNPICSAGIWIGFRGRTLSGGPEVPIGVAVDLKAGFGFGFGFELEDTDPTPEDDRESAAHVLSGAEIGVGPGVRLGGVLELMPIAGVGVDALAYGFTGSNDEATSEAFWYASAALRLDLGEVDVVGSAARQYRDQFDRYGDRIEVEVSWPAEKKGRVGVAVWWIDYDRFTVAGGGMVVGPLDR